MVKMRGIVHFDQDRCKGCGLCVIACPEGIIIINLDTTNFKGYQPATVMDMKNCIACGNCYQSCPDYVIKIERIAN